VPCSSVRYLGLTSLAIARMISDNSYLRAWKPERNDTLHTHVQHGKRVQYRSHRQWRSSWMRRVLGQKVRSTCHTIIGCDELTVWRVDWFPGKVENRQCCNKCLHGRCSVSVLWSSPATAWRRRVTCLITLNYPRLRCLRLLVGPGIDTAVQIVSVPPLTFIQLQVCRQGCQLHNDGGVDSEKKTISEFHLTNKIYRNRLITFNKSKQIRRHITKTLNM